LQTAYDKLKSDFTHLSKEFETLVRIGKHNQDIKALDHQVRNEIKVQVTKVDQTLS
jgi:hypothetical protein